MNLEPAKADPEDVARKLAAAPGLKLPPEPSYDLLPDGRVAQLSDADHGAASQGCATGLGRRCSI